MVIDWQGVIINVAATVGGGGVCVAGAAWLVKAVVTDRLKANADAEIERLKNELMRDTKLFEAQLKSSSDAEIERLKSALQAVAVEHQIRFSELHEKRAQVIADLYTRLANVEREGRIYIHRSSAHVLNDGQGEAPPLMALRELDIFVNQHRIYLSETICALLARFSALLEEPVIHALVYADVDSQNPRTLKKMDGGFSQAFEVLKKDIPAVRKELDQEFRHILGAS